MGLDGGLLINALVSVGMSWEGRFAHLPEDSLGMVRRLGQRGQKFHCPRFLYNVFYIARLYLSFLPYPLYLSSSFAASLIAFTVCFGLNLIGN